MSDLIQFDLDELPSLFSDDSIREELEGAELLVSLYETPAYEGYCFILYRKGGELYEVNGSHCSCHGLEDQWDPTVTNWRALASRCFYQYDNREEILEFIADNLDEE